MSSFAVDRVGPYRLINLLRQGQACDLWEVELLSGEARGEFPRRMAMKFLAIGYRHTKEEYAFLKHEYFVGRQIDHHYVIKMYEFETVREGTYLNMELFRVLNLKQWFHQGVEKLFPIAEVVLRRAAAGMAALHEKGFIHRDIKPDNFLLDEEGEIRLIDFNLAVKQKVGLAKMFSPKAKVQGTKSYMSPEQIRGNAVDERSDLYSFACMVHEMFTGRAPFTGASSVELLNKHLKAGVPSMAVVNNNIRPDFCSLVQKCLSKDPKRRPPSMREFVREMGHTKIFKILPKAPESEDEEETAEKGGDESEAK